MNRTRMTAMTALLAGLTLGLMTTNAHANVIFWSHDFEDEVGDADGDWNPVEWAGEGLPAPPSGGDWVGKSVLTGDGGPTTNRGQFTPQIPLPAEGDVVNNEMTFSAYYFVEDFDDTLFNRGPFNRRGFKAGDDEDNKIGGSDINLSETDYGADAGEEPTGEWVFFEETFDISPWFDDPNAVTLDLANLSHIMNPDADALVAAGLNEVTTTMYLDDVQVTFVPEPASLALLGAGGLLALSRRRAGRA